MKDMVLDLFSVNDLKCRKTWSSNRLPKNYDDFEKYSHIILGHLTSEKNLYDIMEKGLLPRDKGTQEVEGSTPTNPEYVYLSNCMHSSYYLSRATDNSTNYKGIVIIVKIKRDNLEADENTFSPVELKKVDIKSQYALWRSLCFGLCKHHGAIKKENMLGIYSKDGSCIWRNESAVSMPSTRRGLNPV